MRSHSLLQGLFPTQGSKRGLLHCGQILYHLSHQRNFAPEESALVFSFSFSFFFWPYCIWRLSSLTRYQPVTLQWKRDVSTTGLPGNSPLVLLERKHERYIQVSCTKEITVRKWSKEERGCLTRRKCSHLHDGAAVSNWDFSRRAAYLVVL